MNKICLIATFSLTLSFGVLADGATIYEKSCKACHQTGTAGAPRKGVTKEWQARLDKGLDILVASVILGMNVMPPKGMCPECSDAEIKSAIVFMSKQSGRKKHGNEKI